MKKYFTLIALVFCLHATAQYVNIPDSNFRNWIYSQYPNCFNSSKQMDTTCYQVININLFQKMSTYYDTSLRDLTGIEYFKNLLYISFTKCVNLRRITAFPNKVIEIDLNNCVFDSLPNFPDSLRILNCSYTVGSKPGPLKKIGKFSSMLTKLKCDGQSISKLETIPNSVIEINCNNNELDTIPIVGNSLKNLYCNNNKIRNLGKLPDSLKILECYNNKLKQLGILPPKLIKLTCFKNPLYTLPLLPDSLQMLLCGSDSLTFLPNLPKSLKTLNICYNDIKSLPDLPKSLSILWTIENPNLTCFPYLPKGLKELNFDGNNIKCFPNLPDTFLFFNSGIYPYQIDICNPTNNINNCQSFPTIQSYAFTDNNNNDKQDANEFPKNNLKLTLSNNNKTYTNAQGIAYINADSLGTYTITAQAPPLYKVVPASYTHTFNRYDTIVYDTFALQPLISKDSVSIQLTPINWAARPGFGYVYKCDYENVGTTVLNPTIDVVLDTSQYSFDSTSNNIISFNGKTISYSFNNFTSGQTGSFYIYGKIKTNAILGSTLTALATISSNAANDENASFTLIRGSYDPNDKQATPNLSVQQVADNNHFINYTIRFQNTGTDTAFTVVVADTLNSSKLQLNTLEITNSSHSVKTTQNDNVVFFECRNINLPDSNTNKVGSNGFVSFRIKPLTTLTNGEIVPNKAAIYFDYNTPVITNTAATTIGTLPLTLLNFYAIANAEKNSVLVSWHTANEINTSHFVIEQSITGKEFKAVAELAAKGIGSNHYYTTIAKNNIEYVRLKMIDKDGRFTYSKIIKLPTSQLSNAQLTIISPAKTNLKIAVHSSELNNTKAQIINAQGKVVKECTLYSGDMNINITALANGVYYLSTPKGSFKFVVE